MFGDIHIEKPYRLLKSEISFAKKYLVVGLAFMLIWNFISIFFKIVEMPLRNNLLTVFPINWSYYVLGNLHFIALLLIFYGLWQLTNILRPLKEGFRNTAIILFLIHLTIEFIQPLISQYFLLSSSFTRIIINDVFPILNSAIFGIIMVYIVLLLYSLSLNISSIFRMPVFAWSYTLIPILLISLKFVPIVITQNPPESPVTPVTYDVSPSYYVLNFLLLSLQLLANIELLVRFIVLRVDFKFIQANLSETNSRLLLKKETTLRTTKLKFVISFGILSITLILATLTYILFLSDPSSSNFQIYFMYAISLNIYSSFKRCFIIFLCSIVPIVLDLLRLEEKNLKESAIGILTILSIFSSIFLVFIGEIVELVLVSNLLENIEVIIIIFDFIYYPLLYLPLFFAFGFIAQLQQKNSLIKDSQRTLNLFTHRVLFFLPILALLGFQIASLSLRLNDSLFYPKNPVSIFIYVVIGNLILLAQALEFLIVWSKISTKSVTPQIYDHTTNQINS